MVGTHWSHPLPYSSQQPWEFTAHPCIQRLFLGNTGGIVGGGLGHVHFQCWQEKKRRKSSRSCKHPHCPKAMRSNSRVRGDFRRFTAQEITLALHGTGLPVGWRSTGTVSKDRVHRGAWNTLSTKSSTPVFSLPWKSGSCPEPGAAHFRFTAGSESGEVTTPGSVQDMCGCGTWGHL